MIEECYAKENKKIYFSREEYNKLFDNIFSDIAENMIFESAKEN